MPNILNKIHRTIIIKSGLLALGLICFGQSYSQNIGNMSFPENDTLECVKKISVYKEFQKLNLPQEAVTAWKLAYHSCKGQKKIVFQDGVKFIRYSLENEKDSKNYNLLVDSLMNIYNERIKYFGEEGLVIGMQGVDLLRYGKTGHLDKTFKLLTKSVELTQPGTEPAVLVSLMNCSYLLYQNEKINTLEFTDIYLSNIDLLNKQLQNEKDKSKVKALEVSIELIDNIFSRAKISDCQSLENSLNNWFLNSKENISELKRLQNLLLVFNCQGSHLMMQISEKLYLLQPNAQNAYLLAGLSMKNNHDTEAVQYLEKAIDHEIVDSLKAVYFYDLAAIYCYRLKKWQQARDYAYESVRLKKDFGKAYFLMGDCYALSVNLNGQPKFEDKAIFWAALDKFSAAITYDHLLKEIAGQKIKYYSRMIPTKEELFMNGFKEGEPYLVGGWINEKTTVRARND